MISFKIDKHGVVIKFFRFRATFTYYKDRSHKIVNDFIHRMTHQPKDSDHEKETAS